MSTNVRILEPGQIEAPRGEIPFLFPPQGDVFARRAERLRQLSKKNALGEYLSFLALLSDAQQEALDIFPDQSLPASDELIRRCEEGKPLFDAQTWLRHEEWQSALDLILQRMNEASLPSSAHEAISHLMQASEAHVDEIADRIVAGDLAAVAPRELPFIAAALQVYFVHLASSVEQSVLGKSARGSRCPVCGSHPMVGMVRSTGQEQGLRYLTCSLCAAQWHMVRIKCSSCESTEGIDYHLLEGSNGAVKAESCSKCGTYLKLLYLSKDARLEATADDLAARPLDILMSSAGKMRCGPNLFYHPGSSPIHD